MHSNNKSGGCGYGRPLSMLLNGGSRRLASLRESLFHAAPSLGGSGIVGAGNCSTSRFADRDACWPPQGDVVGVQNPPPDQVYIRQESFRGWWLKLARASQPVAGES
jgi:hypothetical protein